MICCDGDGDVGAVGDGEVARHLLLDGDLRARAPTLVSLARPWGSILMRLAPNKRCRRLLTVVLSAWLISRLEASPPNPKEPPDCREAADSSRVRPRASSAMTSASGSWRFGLPGDFQSVGLRWRRR